MSQPFPRLPGCNHIISCEVLAFTKRLVFDIKWQHPDLIWRGDDDGDYYLFTASNGYQIISRSRMDIQTERLWLLGAKCDTVDGSRSGTMVFSDNQKRDFALSQFRQAMTEWINYVTER